MHTARRRVVAGPSSGSSVTGELFLPAERRVCVDDLRDMALLADEREPRATRPGMSKILYLLSVDCVASLFNKIQEHLSVYGPVNKAADCGRFAERRGECNHA